jgi:hypothetical protein
MSYSYKTGVLHNIHKRCQIAREHLNIVTCFLRYLFFFRVIMAEPKFTIEEDITRQYRRFNAVGTQLTVRLLLRLKKKIRTQCPIS